MPRKTKKTSTAKSADTKKTCEPSLWDIWCAISGVGLVIAGLVYAGTGLFSKPTIPQTVECYQRVGDEDTVAQAYATGSDFGKYTKVFYSAVTAKHRSWSSEYTPTIERPAHEFNEMYDKLPNCDKFYRIKGQITIDAQEKTITEMAEELAAFKRKCHK